MKQTSSYYSKHVKSGHTTVQLDQISSMFLSMILEAKRKSRAF